MTIQVQLINSGGQATFDGSISPSPLYMLGPFPFTFATPGLTTGVPLVILPEGALIYDIGIVVIETFDGTTPLADVGEFSGTTGLFKDLATAAVDVTVPYDQNASGSTHILSASNNAWLAPAIGSIGADAGAVYLPGTLVTFAATTLSLVVSQDGAKGGTATGATHGTGSVFVLVATPQFVVA
jgi:hypothetical protein